MISGGPGAGKSTLIETLSKHGYSTVAEQARQIIKAQLSIEGEGVHGKDTRLFRELMLAADIRAYEDANRSDTVTFFDRGIVDVLGYSRLMGLNDESHILGAVHLYRYQPTVLIAPPWKPIYCQDSERRQSFSEAEDTYHALSKAYRDMGYELVELPKVSVDLRLEFLVNEILR